MYTIKKHRYLQGIVPVLLTVQDQLVMEGKQTHLNYGVMNEYRPSLGVAQCPNMVVQHVIVLPLKTAIYKLILQ
jgi:hypothetical protein